MPSDLAISVKNVSKAYTVWRDPKARLQHPLLSMVGEVFPLLRKKIDAKLRGLCSEFYALRDVSFEIKKGESVGIIGKNGSGKSTLLQMIAGTLQPTEGSIAVNGRVAALLELGSGFNPEFTGRENVYLNASILGLTREETEERFAKIEAFADIGDFIDQPVKTYSSGMAVRLAFAVCINIDPEILIIDEALAVGDMYFQAKCITAIKQIQSRGVTVLFVSHDANALNNLCERGVYLDHGCIKMIGPAPSVGEKYIQAIREEMNHMNSPAIQSKNSINPQQQDCFVEGNDITSKLTSVAAFHQRYGTGHARIQYIGLLDQEGHPLEVVHFNEEVSICIIFTAYNSQKISANYYIQDEKKNLILGADPRLIGQDLVQGEEEKQFFVKYTTRLPLREGNYTVQFQLVKPEIIDETGTFYDVIDNAIAFKMLRRTEARLWAQTFFPTKMELSNFKQ